MSDLIAELRGLVILVVGAALAVVGARMGNDTLLTLGGGIICGALGITVPGRGALPRDSNARTRSTDGP